MLKFVILLSATACALGAAIPEGLLPQLDGRIVGGEDATIEAFPWQISLQRGNYHSCGGSIYTPDIIVTAAHCVSGATVSALRIRAGSTTWNSGGVTIPVAAYVIHEGYSRGTMVNDIALLRLSSPLTYSSSIQSIGLASVAPPDGAAAAVSGWGTLESGGAGIPTILQSVDVSIISRSVCGSKAYSYGGSIRATMICAAAAGKDACQGDSGGPLVSGGELVGVVSWGIGCASPKHPGVYSDVADLHSWVVENANTV